MTTAMVWILCLMVLAAAVSDLATRRIPNWITVGGAVCGIASHALNHGPWGAVSSVAGMLLGLAIFMAFYIAGGMGAGDVKLFGAVGAFVGPQSLIVVFVLTGLLGGVAGVALALARGRLGETLSSARGMLFDLGHLRFQEIHRSSAQAGPNALRLPYGAVIAVGTLVSLFAIR